MFLSLKEQSLGWLGLSTTVAMIVLLRVPFSGVPETPLMLLAVALKLLASHSQWYPRFRRSISISSVSLVLAAVLFVVVICLMAYHVWLAMHLLLLPVLFFAVKFVFSIEPFPSRYPSAFPTLARDSFEQDHSSVRPRGESIDGESTPKDKSSCPPVQPTLHLVVETVETETRLSSQCFKWWCLKMQSFLLASSYEGTLALYLMLNHVKIAAVISQITASPTQIFPGPDNVDFSWVLVIILPQFVVMCCLPELDLNKQKERYHASQRPRQASQSHQTIWQLSADRLPFSDKDSGECTFKLCLLPASLIFIWSAWSQLHFVPDDEDFPRMRRLYTPIIVGGVWMVIAFVGAFLFSMPGAPSETLVRSEGSSQTEVIGGTNNV